HRDAARPLSTDPQSQPAPRAGGRPGAAVGNRHRVRRGHRRRAGPGSRAYRTAYPAPRARRRHLVSRRPAGVPAPPGHRWPAEPTSPTPAATYTTALTPSPPTAYSKPPPNQTERNNAGALLAVQHRHPYPAKNPGTPGEDPLAGRTRLPRTQDRPRHRPLR